MHGTDPVERCGLVPDRLLDGALDRVPIAGTRAPDNRAYRAAWQQYATFDGRTSRRDFWGYFLVNGMILVVGPVLILFGEGGDLTDNPAPGLVILNTGLLVYVLAQIVPSIAISVRRLHDTGHSGWWTCFVLIGLFGYLVLIVFWSLQSETVPNDYGPPSARTPTESGAGSPPVGSDPSDLIEELSVLRGGRPVRRRPLREQSSRTIVK